MGQLPDISVLTVCFTLINLLFQRFHFLSEISTTFTSCIFHIISFYLASILPPLQFSLFSLI
jgi:hypothetical protein